MSALGPLVDAAVAALARDGEPEPARSQTPDSGRDPSGGIAVAERVSSWLASPSDRLSGVDRTDVDALCRQIDVLRRVDRSYGPSWTRSETPEPASSSVRFGLVVVLVAQGAFVADPTAPDRAAGARLDGFALKCLNSALKLLELGVDDGEHPDRFPVDELRVAALAALDQIGDAGAQP